MGFLTLGMKSRVFTVVHEVPQNLLSSPTFFSISISQIVIGNIVTLKKFFVVYLKFKFN